jgi:hypothetical protein
MAKALHAVRHHRRRDLQAETLRSVARHRWREPMCARPRKRFGGRTGRRVVREERQLLTERAAEAAVGAVRAHASDANV